MQEMTKEANKNKDGEIQKFLEQQKNLESEIKKLQKIIDEDNRDVVFDQLNKEKKAAELRSYSFMAEDYQRDKKNALRENPTDKKLLMDPKNIEDS